MLNLSKEIKYLSTEYKDRINLVRGTVPDEGINELLHDYSNFLLGLKSLELQHPEEIKTKPE